MLWIDEAQYLHHSILADLKLLMNFEMDSRNYAIMILSGLPSLVLPYLCESMKLLYQRIEIHYFFGGILQTQIKEYIRSRLELCGVNKSIMEEAVYEVIGSYCNGSIRKLNNLIHKALILGCSKNVTMLDKEAISEAELI